MGLVHVHHERHPLRKLLLSLTRDRDDILPENPWLAGSPTPGRAVQTPRARMHLGNNLWSEGHLQVHGLCSASTASIHRV